MKETIISQLEKIANESDFDTKDAIDFIEETDRELESLREKNEELWPSNEEREYLTDVLPS